MDGGAFTVFDRSVLVSNGLIHGQVCSQNNSGDCLEKFLVLLMQPVTELQLLDRIRPPTEDLKKKGIDFSLWFKPDKYPTDF